MIITVASGKGGTGKTLVATSLAQAVGKCTYVDLDVEEPNGYILLKPEIKEVISFVSLVPEINTEKCTFCRQCVDACAFNALSIIPSLKKVLFFPELCHSCGHCSYICPIQGAIDEVKREIGKIRMGNSKDIRFLEGRINVGEASGVPLIRGIVSGYINKDELTIVDSSPGTSCPVVESIRESDWVVLVTEPTPFGLNDLKLTVELVQDLHKKASIIVNKDNNGCLIDRYAESQNIPVILKIPYSVRIQKYYSRGIPLLETMTGIKREFKNIISDIRFKHEKN